MRGKRFEIIADCLNDHTIPPIILARGREESLHHTLGGTYAAEKGTMLHRIFSKLVREGRAEIVVHGQRTVESEWM